MNVSIDQVIFKDEKVKSNWFKRKGLRTPKDRCVKYRVMDVASDYSINTPVTQEIFKQRRSSAKFTEVSALWQGVQEWIRQEIVDDDPYDEETFGKVDCNHGC